MVTAGSAPSSAARPPMGYEYRNRASRRMRSTLPAAACGSGWSQMWSHSPGFAGVRPDPSLTVSPAHGRWRTPVNAGQHCWKACSGQPLASSNLASSAMLTCKNTQDEHRQDCLDVEICLSFVSVSGHGRLCLAVPGRCADRTPAPAGRPRGSPANSDDLSGLPSSSPAPPARATAEPADAAGRGAAANITRPIWPIQSGVV